MLCDEGEGVMIASVSSLVEVFLPFPYLPKCLLHSHITVYILSLVYPSQGSISECIDPDGFDADLESRPRAIPVGVEIDVKDPASPTALEAFETKIRIVEETGCPTPRAVLLCNPHNSLGMYIFYTVLCRCTTERIVKGFVIHEKLSLLTSSSSSDTIFTRRSWPVDRVSVYEYRY